MATTNPGDSSSNNDSARPTSALRGNGRSTRGLGRMLSVPNLKAGGGRKSVVEFAAPIYSAEELLTAGKRDSKVWDTRPARRPTFNAAESRRKMPRASMALIEKVMGTEKLEGQLIGGSKRHLMMMEDSGHSSQDASSKKPLGGGLGSSRMDSARGGMDDSSHQYRDAPKRNMPSAFGMRGALMNQRSKVSMRNLKLEAKRENLRGHQPTLGGVAEDGEEGEESADIELGLKRRKSGSVKMGLAKRASLLIERQSTVPLNTENENVVARLDMVVADERKEGGLVSPLVGGNDAFENYDPTKHKRANKYFRWNLLWLVFCLFAPYPLWLSFLSCRLAYEITIIVNIVMSLNFIYTTAMCWLYMWNMIRAFNTPYWQELDEELREKIQHIVVMPTYKEPVELLVETLSSVANQTVADSIVVVVGMEEKTPDIKMKKKILREQFKDSFRALVFSIHPSGVPGEIAGACSNRNYAARTAVKHMIKEGMLPVDPVTAEVELDFTTVTVCDADTTFFYRYFENLTWCFLNEHPSTRYKVCWQSPLFYNIALDERWFFTRVMGILRSYFMIGFLIGCDINTMSIYSQSLRLLVESRYFHPGYQMDDIIYTLSAMKATGIRIRIRTLDIPTLSGPTSGETLMKELDEWIVQATRWTIGAAEVFHYFFVKMLRCHYFLPGLAYFWWFVYYYGFVLCVAGLINICNFIIQMVGIKHTEVSIEECKPFESILPDNFGYTWVFPGFLIFTQVVVFGTAFCMDALVSQILALNEDVNPIRNVIHWLSTQFVLWMYCLVEYKGIFTIAIYGKSVCGHIASDKGALAKPTGEGGAAAPGGAEKQGLSMTVDFSFSDSDSDSNKSGSSSSGSQGAVVPKISMPENADATPFAMPTMIEMSSSSSSSANSFGDAESAGKASKFHKSIRLGDISDDDDDDGSLHRLASMRDVSTYKPKAGAAKLIALDSDSGSSLGDSFEVVSEVGNGSDPKINHTQKKKDAMKSELWEDEHEQKDESFHEEDVDPGVGLLDKLIRSLHAEVDREVVMPRKKDYSKFLSHSLA